ncbi:MAG: NADP oxidoreductase, partial [Dehalococcoidia bacterium]|nr:NADP oxidoreductase [Dehalococcoidia bacterium]
KAGHEVVIANSRGPESLGELIAKLGPGASAASVSEAARQGDLVIEAIPFGKVHTLPRAELEGKVLITAANYYPGRDGEIDLGGLTESEYLHRLLPKTHIAKVFNTIHWEHLRVEGDTSKTLAERRVLPFAASDVQAESRARQLIEELGFGPLFLGELAQVRGLSEPDDLLYNKQLTLAQAQSLVAAKS